MPKPTYRTLWGLGTSVLIFSICNVAWLHSQLHSNNNFRLGNDGIDKSFRAKAKLGKSDRDSLQVIGQGQNNDNSSTIIQINSNKKLINEKKLSSEKKQSIGDKSTINVENNATSDVQITKNKLAQQDTIQMNSFKKQQLEKNSNVRDGQSKKMIQVEDKLSYKSERHKHSHHHHKRNNNDLSCKKFGGLSDEITAEMSYWSYIPSDRKQKSPFYDPDKYLSFELDTGNWNNKRVSFETMAALARATGRTLVMPPKDYSEFRFTDYLNDEILNERLSGLNVISMDEFLQRKAITGQLKDKINGTVLKPPKNRVLWDGMRLQRLWEYLRNVGFIQEGWFPDHCVAAIPSGPGKEKIDEIMKMWSDIHEEKVGPLPDPEIDYEGRPTPVDAPAVDRLRELVAQREKLCIYDEKLQNADLIHFPVILNTNDDDEGENFHERFFQHFYAFIFFQDWKQDLLVKRFIRDYVRYKDEFFCVAGQIVEAMREHAKSEDRTNINGEFDTMHIRRGDFAEYFPAAVMGSHDLFNRTKDWLQEKGTIYIATNEEDPSHFDIFREHHTIFFLGDFKDILEDIDSVYYGVIEQLVVTKGKVFIGTWWSTLSGYVNRMRGYYISKYKLEGYEEGTMRSYYFAPEHQALAMTSYRPVKPPFFMREFPISWRDIDNGIEEESRI